MPDAELLQRYTLHRDTAALELLVWRYGSMVLASCRGFLGSGPDAEDAFQATFLVLARRAASIRKTTSLASWLYGVSWRCALRLRANLAKRRRHERNVAGSPDRDYCRRGAARSIMARGARGATC